MNLAERLSWSRVVTVPLLGIVLVLCLLTNISCNKHLTDEQIADRFRDNREDLEELVRMAGEDGVQDVYFDLVYLKGRHRWRPGEPGFTQEKHEAYKELFKRTGTVRLTQDQNGVEICCVSVVVSDIDGVESYVSSKSFYFGTWEGGAELSPPETARSNRRASMDQNGARKWYIRTDHGISKPE